MQSTNQINQNEKQPDGILQPFKAIVDSESNADTSFPKVKEITPE